MKNVILIGLGRFGKYTVMKLHALGHQIMAVDKNEERINKILNYVDSAQIGDSTDKDFIDSLEVKEYDLCIVAIGDDFLSSLETVSLLKEAGAVKVVARATGDLQEKFLLRNGADAVVFPERQLGAWTALRYTADNIENYIELMDGYSIFEVVVPNDWAGKEVGQLDVRNKYGINILGVRNGIMKMDIGRSTVLKVGQTMLVLGQTEKLQKLFRL